MLIALSVVHASYCTVINETQPETYNLNIRRLTQDDLSRYWEISGHAFGRGRRNYWSAESFLAHDKVRIGIEESGRIVAQLTIIPYELWFGSTLRPCGGIAGVAVDPAYRGRGYAGALVRECLAMMRASGQYLSLLWPFDERFYQAYGWEWTGVCRQVTVPVRRLISGPETEGIRSLTSVDEWHVLQEVYDRFAQRYNGATKRRESVWKEQFEHWDGRHPQQFVYVQNGRPDGYAIVRYTDEPDTASAELVACSLTAYRGLLGLMKRHDMTVQKFSWQTPMDDPLWSIIGSQDVKTSIESLGMGRVVDVEMAFRALTPDANSRGSMRLDVVDPTVKANHGTWELEWAEGVISASRSSQAAGVSMSICALSQAYWGTPGLEELRRCEKVTVSDEDQFSDLSQLLPATTVWSHDYF